MESKYGNFTRHGVVYVMGLHGCYEKNTLGLSSSNERNNDDDDASPESAGICPCAFESHAALRDGRRGVSSGLVAPACRQAGLRHPEEFPEGVLIWIILVAM